MPSSSLWFFCSLGAALLWGVSYALSGKVLSAGLPVSWYLVCEIILGVPVFIALALYDGKFSQHVAWLKANPSMLVMLVVAGLCFVLGTYLIVFSISLKNATLASLIEISYPLFTCLFAWLFFRDVHLNMATAFGALLILAGTCIIYLKSGH